MDRNTHIGPRGQHEQPNQNNEYVHRKPKDAPRASSLNPTRSIVRIPHPHVGGTPEDEPKEAIEQAAHQAEEIGKKGDHLRNDECHYPQDREDAAPGRPSDDGMRALVACTFEDAEEDEASGYTGVQDAEENERGDHEGEGHFFVDFVSEGSERGSGVVLRPCISVDDRPDKTEQDDLGDGYGPKRLGEVLGILHFGDEARKRDLADEGIANIQKGVHATDEGGS